MWNRNGPAYAEPEAFTSLPTYHSGPEKGLILVACQSWKITEMTVLAQGRIHSNYTVNVYQANTHKSSQVFVKHKHPESHMHTVEHIDWWLLGVF